jgi:hypothetical protein
LRHPTQRQYLVVCIQAGCRPYWVPRNYLVQFNSADWFPLRDEEEFQRVVAASDVSVDLLLERILSAAQYLVIENNELLRPVKQCAMRFTPEPDQIQRSRRRACHQMRHV